MVYRATLVVATAVQVVGVGMEEMVPMVRLVVVGAVENELSCLRGKSAADIGKIGENVAVQKSLFMATPKHRLRSVVFSDSSSSDFT